MNEKLMIILLFLMLMIVVIMVVLVVMHICKIYRYLDEIRYEIECICTDKKDATSNTFKVEIDNEEVEIEDARKTLVQNT